MVWAHSDMFIFYVILEVSTRWEAPRSGSILRAQFWHCAACLTRSHKHPAVQKIFLIKQDVFFKNIKYYFYRTNKQSIWLRCSQVPQQHLYRCNSTSNWILSSKTQCRKPSLSPCSYTGTPRRQTSVFGRGAAVLAQRRLKDSIALGVETNYFFSLRGNTLTWFKFKDRTTFTEKCPRYNIHPEMNNNDDNDG